MKILIACDALTSANKLYYDLKRAGLSVNTEVYVLSVADLYIVSDYKPSSSKRAMHGVYVQHVKQELGKAQKRADDLTKKLKVRFPSWRFKSVGASGSPAWEIVKKAREWEIDLIVVGSHGRPGPGEFFVGSVALSVLSSAPCSVRIVRQKTEETDSPTRMVIGVDGSKTSEAVIDLLARRQWMKGSAVHLVTAIDTVVYTKFLSYDSYYPTVAVATLPMDSSIKKEWRARGSKRPEAWIKKMHQEYKEKLEKYGLIVSSVIKEGEPKEILLKEAKRWGAECIFVGALGHTRLERFFMGSVSSAIVARAHCTVEIVREPII